MQKEPLVVTILMDDPSHQYFTQLRDQYFPRYCNYLEAHITLFHKLPSNKNIITDTLKKYCQREIFSMEITSLKNIGTGVAFEIRSPELMKLHETLQEKFSRYLTRQDRKKLWPHITIQNKVTAFKATKTLAVLQENFTPMQVQALGMESWLYKGGPWEKTAEHLFEQNKI